VRHAREAGFTLIELLVSLLVLGMAGGLLVSGVGVGNRVWERAERRAAVVDAVASAQGIIRAKVSGLTPVTLYVSTPYSDVSGERDKFFWTGPAPEADRPDVIAAYRLSLSTGAELVLSTVSDVAPEEDAPRRDMILLRNVREIEFDYFGAAPPDNTRRWRDRWAARPRPPELVRLRVRFPDGDSREWPALVMRPAAVVDVNCVLNIVTGTCKGR